MGTKLCIQAPRDQEDGCSLSSSDSEDYSNPFKRFKTKLSTESQMNSTDFKCDPTESFRRNIKSICKRKRMPFLSEIHRYNFYIWSSNKYGFGHDSIVIGSSDTKNNNYGYITAELCVDIDEKTVFPNTHYLNQYEANNYLNSSKWKYQYSYTTTLNCIIQLILDLIVNHGEYSNLHNGCQHFVEAFLQKIIKSEHELRMNKILNADTIYNTTNNKYIRGFKRYKAHNIVCTELKNEDLSIKYDTMESRLQIAGTVLLLPVVVMAISKETVKHNRDRVHFKCVAH